MKKIIVRGFRQDTIPADQADVKSGGNLELKGSYVLSSSRAAANLHEINIEKNDLVEFVFEDDTTWMGDIDILHDIFPETVKKRSAGEGFEVPMYMRADDASRGLLGDVAVKLLNVFTKKAVKQKVIDVAARLEKKALQNMSGIYRVDADFNLSSVKLKDSTKPFLFFLHGTNSSTFGSFGELKNTGLWKNMRSNYGENIIALQHETMTSSPIQNAITVFKQLPDNCTLHIISHSRGGLVGDVLARFCNGNKGFTEAELAYLEKTDRKTDVADLATLQKLAKEKNIIIEKFVRVACPAYGTTILSKRLDHFLNISFNLLGTLFGPAASLVAAEFKELIAAAVDTKNDPGQLPGLEAMNPASPFLKVLNNPENRINSPLAVISGNCGLGFNLKALLIIASKLFYQRNNDLVVDTPSMYCGSKRQAPVQYFFDQGAEVDHMRYFRNRKTQDALWLALKTTTETIPGFAVYEGIVQEAPDRHAMLGLDGGDVYYDEVTGNKPVVIMLPGIMGSNLEQNDKKIWINYFRFLAGELTRLDISKKNVEARSLIKTSYRKLANYLRRDYDVVTLPFDWRLPLTDAAARLNSCVEKILSKKVPIKIIGHSMGGVVTRDFIINHPATWKKLNASPDFRILLLGAPLGGSYRIPYVLAGKDPIIGQLSKIDLRHTKKELLDMFRKYPGLLGLLPLNKDEHDFADAAVWQQMQKASLFNWSIPDKKDLEFFGAYRDHVLQHVEGINMDNIIYVAGKDDSTVCGFEIDENRPDEKLVFKSTAEGDQSVTWDTGIPAKLNNTNRLYFTNVSHGALANDQSIFNGLAEILESGKTDLLSRNRPVLRGVKKIFETVEEEVFDLDETTVENTILGLKQAKPERTTGSVPLKVSVSHGDLYYSSYPVVVGHFVNDGITSAEKIIDYYSNYALSQRHRLNMYPGDIGTSEFFVDYSNDFKGTLVVGLGAPGKLSSFQLAFTVEQGVVKYMLEMNKQWRDSKSGSKPDQLGISVLLVGAGYAGLSVESSIRSIIQGVQNANKKLAAEEAGGLRTIGHIEFVELFEDRCLQCLYILSRVETEEDGALHIRMPEKQLKKLLGARKRIPRETETDWWSRITVQMQELPAMANGKVQESVLRFSCSTGSAREEDRDLPTSPGMLAEMIEDMSTNNRWNSGVAKTIFELMIPNDFKDAVKKQRNTMWVLDHAAAAYPWELLQDSITNEKPICCNAGMIRQLKLEEYRLHAKSAGGKKALVVGDPNLQGSKLASQLPGALEEAHRVASILEDEGYEMPNNCFNESSSSIINALFQDEYRIIHLAGHGMFDEHDPDKSGMLIGNNKFLTAKQINQMSKVPDLVFVNCCFLGKVDYKSERQSRNWHKLAANIGTQLIANGVKVVIAAGWAVDDEAALYFTGIFYRAMFGGYNFGEAIQQARTKTFDNYSYTNTWGAYQCYGDPFFKITEARRPKEYRFLIAQEAENELVNLVNMADAKNSTTDYLLKELKAISAAVDAAGIRNATITELEAMLYAECNDYEQAVEKFESLFIMEQAGFSVKALEKYCNLRSKLCVRYWNEGNNKAEQPDLLEGVIADLDKLLALSPTAERLSLKGSACKRKAMIMSNNPNRVKALLQAADCYRRAYEIPANSNKTYALTNWLEIERILIQVKNRQGLKAILKKYPFLSLAALKKKTAEMLTDIRKAEADMDYWKEVARANSILCAWLAEGKDSKEITTKTVVEAYSRVWSYAGSDNKKVTEIEHFEFLMAMYSGLVKNPVLIKMIKKIKQELERQLR